MKKYFSFLPACFLLATAFVACEEVEEVGKYDNWRARNEAYIDSIANVTGANYVATALQADGMELGKLYAIQVQATSTTDKLQYVYCRKLVANPEGIRPNYTGYHSVVSAYYYGTDILGESFDGTFEGYAATDQQIPVPPQKLVTPFDTPAELPVDGVIAGWTWALQYMRSGERWMLYIPWESAYGESGSGDILGYSALVFDLVLDKVLE